MLLEIILWLVSAYLICGFIFAIPFVLIGVSKIDEAAMGSSAGFRIIIIPGVMVFWPLLLQKWRKASIQRP